MKIRRYCLRALVWLVFALPSAPINAHPAIAATPAASTAPQANAPADCDALKHDPLPVLDRLGGELEAADRLRICAHPRGDYRRARVVFEAALEMATRRSDRASRAVALAGLGLTARHARPSRPGRADAARELQDQRRAARQGRDGGGVEPARPSSQQRARYEEARAYHLRSFTLWEAIGDHKRNGGRAEQRRRDVSGGRGQCHGAWNTTSGVSTSSIAWAIAAAAPRCSTTSDASHGRWAITRKAWSCRARRSPFASR